MNILVIDDDEIIRLTIKKSVQKMGYTVVEADNGISGIELFQKENPDMVITDILMPDKEGLETINEIRAVNPQTKIIAMSGGGSTHNMTFLQWAEKVGANQIISKPFKPDELLKIITNLAKA